MASTASTSAFLAPLVPASRVSALARAHAPVATAAPPRPRKRRAPVRAPKTHNASAPREHGTGAVVKAAKPHGKDPKQETQVTGAAVVPSDDASGTSGGLPLPTNTGAARRCGFVALLGPSNSGKSTLLNQLVGQKVAIVTPRVQTTRCRVAGISTVGDTQLIFLDTPGIFEPGSRLARAMVKAAWRSGRDADVVALVVDAAALSRCRSRRPRGGRRGGDMGGKKAEREEGREFESESEDEDVEDDAQGSPFTISPELDGILSGLARARARGRLEHLCIIANKSDMVRGASRRSRVERGIEHMVETVGLSESSLTVLHTSARDGTGVEEVSEWACGKVPGGPWLYDGEAATDMSMRQMACESVRETCLLELRHEIAYQISVECKRFDERKDGSMRVEVDLLVRRDSQKRIVTGSGGEMVKRIGTRARAELSEMVGGATVHLFVTVKVRPGWTEDRQQYQPWGLDFDA